MHKRILDLSVLLEDRPLKPEHHRPAIRYFRHEDTRDAFESFVPGLAARDYYNGKAWATEQVSLSTHSGTHMDAPWHYHPTMNHALVAGGEPSSTIDQVPLEWCIQPGVKLDFREFPAGRVITPVDIEAELDRIGHKLAPLEIVLINTRAASMFHEEEYWQSHCGMGWDSTMYLLERGVRVVGTDAWGWDAPFKHMAQRYAETKDEKTVWGAHKAGMQIGYFQMEKLTNLEKLPPDNFTVVCLPIKIKGASAGWTRAIALLNDDV